MRDGKICFGLAGLGMGGEATRVVVPQSSGVSP